MGDDVGSNASGNGFDATAPTQPTLFRVDPSDRKKRRGIVPALRTHLRRDVKDPEFPATRQVDADGDVPKDDELLIPWDVSGKVGDDSMTPDAMARYRQIIDAALHVVPEMKERKKIVDLCVEALSGPEQLTGDAERANKLADTLLVLGPFGIARLTRDQSRRLTDLALKKTMLAAIIRTGTPSVATNVALLVSYSIERDATYAFETAYVLDEIAEAMGPPELEIEDRLNVVAAVGKTPVKSARKESLAREIGKIEALIVGPLAVQCQLPEVRSGSREVPSGFRAVATTMLHEARTSPGRYMSR